MNKLNKKNEYDKSTTTVVCKCDEVLVLLDEYLHIDDQGVEWLVDNVASYHAIHLEFFSLFTTKLETLT